MNRLSFQSTGFGTPQGQRDDFVVKRIAGKNLRINIIANKSICNYCISISHLAVSCRDLSEGCWRGDVICETFGRRG